MSWYKMKAVINKDDAGADNAAGSTAEIIIDGEIGESWFGDSGTASSDFMRDVSALGDLDAINIKLNSPGGSVSDGVAIANYLNGHKAEVTVTVMGQASSIASVIAASADNVVMGVGAWMLVHKPWTIAIGNSDEMRGIALDLDTIQSSIMAIYDLRVPEDKRAEFEDLVNAETILTADQCVEYGLADSKATNVKAAARLRDFTAAARGAILELHDKAKASATTTESEPKAIASVDELRNVYPNLVSELEAAASAKEVASAAEQACASERDRVMEIISQCKASGQNQLVERLVKNGMSGQAVGDYILDVAAAASDGAGISGQQSGLKAKATAEAVIDHASIYNRRNRQGATR